MKGGKNEEAVCDFCFGRRLAREAFLISSGQTPTEEWVARYEGMGEDGARAMALDSWGNIYVTGYSVRSGTGMDYVTVKYDRNGIQIWAAIYDGPAHGDDEPYGIAVDPLGDVYVAGSSEGIGTGKDYATIKYKGLDGTQLWVDRLNGPGAPLNKDDIAKGIVVDPWGDIIVTGSMWKSYPISQDIATIKYHPDGSRVWEREYDLGNRSDDPSAVVVDMSGNIYITGRSTSANHDFGTIKVDSDGNLLWKAIYDTSYYEGAVALTLDSNTVYVTGWSWASASDPAFYDWATIAYDINDGHQIWLERYGGDAEHSQDQPVAIVTDGFGNVFVTGTCEYSDTSRDLTTIKYRYDPVAGTVTREWVTRHGHTMPEFGRPSKAIALDAFGNIYVIGMNAFDYVTVKYDSLGREQWEKRYNGPLNSTDYPSAIAIDRFGNIFVTGKSLGIGTSYDFATIKYIAPPPARIEEISALITGLPGAAFRPPADERKMALLGKLAEVKEMIAGNLRGAIQKLENDVLAKMDGYFGGNPNNDWIIGHEAQRMLFPMVKALIDQLKALL